MKILVLVDIQNDFVDGTLGTRESRDIIPNVVNLINQYSSEYSSDALILLTKDSHNIGYLDTLEGKYLPVEHCIEDTPGWSINSEVSNAVKKSLCSLYSSPTIRQSRILKNTFGSYELVDVIKSVSKFNNVDEIIFAGLCTDICVISNALMVKSACPDIEISIKADCCAGTTPAAHDAALLVMKSCHINIT